MYQTHKLHTQLARAHTHTHTPKPAQTDQAIHNYIQNCTPGFASTHTNVNRRSRKCAHNLQTDLHQQDLQPEESESQAFPMCAPRTVLHARF